jgi:RHS repeat-associated protein
VECGQLKKVTDALGHSTTYDSYSAQGVTQTTDANGLKTHYTYDTKGRIKTLTQTPPVGASRQTQYTYDPNGQVIQTVLPDGMTLTYTYDAAHYLRSITDNLGNKVEYTYDLKGRRTQELTKDPDGTLVRSLQTAYDVRDKVASINAGGSLTQQLRDALGNLVKETDPNNQTATNPVSTTYNYDPLNRLLKTIDRLSGPTTYGYDSNDRPIAITAPNGITTRYVYDDLGNLLQEQSPQRGIRSYTYDVAGDVLSLTDARGIVLNYTYDALNRVTQIDAPGTNEDIAYVYDGAAGCTNGAGRLCQVIDESGITTYSYDVFGNLSQQTKAELGVTYTTRYTYDAGNRISTITYPDGRTLTYTRDAIGRTTDISMTMNGVTTSLLNTLSYRADGLVKSQTFGNGLTETRTYDLQGRLTSQNLGSVLNQTYSYDANGNLTTVPSGTYGYDVLDRLVQTSLSTQNNNYTYEGNGDILNASFSVIPSGIRNDRYTYTSFGQLASYSKDNVLTASYIYNAQHQRTRKSVGGTTVYHYDLAGNLIQETDSMGTVLRSYVWLNQTPIVQIDNATPERITYLQVDHLNTPRWGTNSTGTLVWKWEGESYGQSFPVEDVDQDGTLVTVNLRFPGQYFDAESGLFYNWNRYYDPRMGRYITSDPIGLKSGLNTYTYVTNNPVSGIDPYGLYKWYGSMDVAGFLTGSVGYLDLTSECVNDRKFHIKVVAVSGVGISVFYKSKLPRTEDKGVIFDDYALSGDLDPVVFNGTWQSASFGIGVGTRIMRCGHAWSSASGKGAGIIVGAQGVIWGSCTVLSVEEKKCCEKK